MDELKYTPENITELEPDDIFVFGSNLAGMHLGGAARTAVEKFGAIMGQGVASRDNPMPYPRCKVA